ncbi:hypothetical protein [Pseudescherichia sp.]|uniref:hypothetical protein n=1 Tax=Pseudescherichia sp. TaxID=2055881 RepID=UPI002897B118|nr:hypothetical protein [Pseudescherichia sp.]
MDKSKSFGENAYNDIKKVLKYLFVIALVVSAMGVAWLGFGAYQAYKIKKEREDILIPKAMEFTRTHVPTMLYRDEFGTKEMAMLWFVGDTDNHAIIKVSGKIGVYSTSQYSSISFFNQAGEACESASASINESGKINSLSCDNKIYFTK